MHIQSESDFLEVLKHNYTENAIGSLKNFKILAYSLEQQKLMKVRYIHPYAIGAWFNYCHFEFPYEKTAYFLLSRTPFLAVGRLNEKDFLEQKEHIVSGQHHSFVSSLEYTSFQSLSYLSDLDYHTLDPSLMNSYPSGDLLSAIRAHKLVSSDVLNWGVNNVAQLIFNWWDD